MHMAPSYVKSEVCRSDLTGNGAVENTLGLHILKDHNMLPVFSNSDEASKGSRNLPGFNTSTNEGRAQAFKQAIHGNSGPTGNDNNQVSKFRLPSIIVCPGISSGDEPSVPHVTEYKRRHTFKQTGNNHLDNVYLQKKEPQSRNLQSEKPKYGPPVVTSVVGRRSLRPVDSVFRENAKPRVSVWDRLGRPSSDERIVTTKDPDVQGNDVLKRKRVEDPENAPVPFRLMFTEPASTLREKLKREIPASDNTEPAGTISEKLKREIPASDNTEPAGTISEKPKREIPASNDSSGTVLPSISDDFESKLSEPELNLMCLLHPADTSIMKRHFSVIGSGSANDSGSSSEKKFRHLQDTETLQEVESSLSVKYNCSESLNCVSSGTKLRDQLHASPERFRPPDSAFVQGANSVSRSKLSQEALKATHSLVSNCSITRSDSNEASMKTDLKPAHAQIQDMKLRLHQVDEEISKLKAKQLEYNAYKPDIPSNSGALSHPGNNVESGTISVTNVMRKADMAVVTSVSPHSLRKASRSQLSHSNRKVVPTPYFGSLRWQGDQPATIGLSTTTPRQRLKATVRVEQISNDSVSQLHNPLNTKTSMAKEENIQMANPAWDCKETLEGYKRNQEEEESKKTREEGDARDT